MAVLIKQRAVHIPNSLFSHGGAAKPPATVFVAYVFNNDESTKFRNELKLLLNSERNIVVKDGHVNGGDDWSGEVRKRIENAKLVVADLTGPSREVLFEVGFARNKPLIPVIRNYSDLAALPRWLSISQNMFYAKSGGVSDIAHQIATCINNQEYPKRKKRLVDPNKAVFVYSKTQNWASDYSNTLRSLFIEKGMFFQTIAAEDVESHEELVNTFSGLISVVTIDGGNTDYLSHLVLGDIAGKQMHQASGNRCRLLRTGIALGESDMMLKTFIADSIARIPRRIKRVSDKQTLLTTIKSAAEGRNKWMAAKDDDDL